MANSLRFVGRQRFGFAALGTALLVLLLLLIPSARAFDLTITNLNGVTIVQGGLHTFFLEVSIPANERVPVQNLQLTITGPTPVSASFNALLTSVTKSPQITELVLVDGVNSGFGYGYGYDFGPRPAAFHGYGYSFGSGHGFGYGYGYGFAPRLKYRVTLNTATMGTGTYSAKLRWNTGESTPSFFESDTVTFAVIAELGVVPTLTPTPTPTPKPTPTPIAGATVSTAIVIDELQKSVLDGRVQAIFGPGVVSTGTGTNITSTAAGDLTTQLGVTGLTAGQAVTGNLNVTVGTLTVTTTNGVGTAVVDLGGGVKVEANAVVTAVKDALQVVLQKPTLRIQPSAPDVTTLTGGSAEVTKVGADLGVGLKKLPDGASVKVEFAKDASAFVSQPGTVFQLAAQQVGGKVENVSEDVAFVVNVTKAGITNADLGDNKVQLQVSKAWYDARLAQKKDIVITKVGDDGKVYTQKAVCTVAGEVVNCTVTFTGAASGLSVFALMAVAQAPTPTPSPTPIVTAVATPRLPRTGDLDTERAASGVLLAGLVLLSVGAVLFLRRRPRPAD